MDDRAEMRITSPHVVVGLALLALLVVVLASASGPVDVVSRPPLGIRTSAIGSPTVTPTTVTASPVGTPPVDRAPFTLPPLVSTAVRVLVLLAVAAAVVFLSRWLRRHAPRLSTRMLVDRPVEVLPEVLPDVITDTAASRMSLLRNGTPRNAIVACWLDLEEAAATVGLPRHPAETSAEYTRRVLLTWDVAPDAIGRLAALFREARFSQHALTEEDRESAVRELGRLHDDLRRVADELTAARELAEAERAVG